MNFVLESCTEIIMKCRNETARVGLFKLKFIWGLATYISKKNW